MVDDANYPEGLFPNSANSRSRADVSNADVEILADSIRVLESTVKELRKDIKAMRNSVSMINELLRP
jgi:outer membrane murein-binding lipoprotein Lpp